MLITKHTYMHLIVGKQIINNKYIYSSKKDLKPSNPAKELLTEMHK